MEEKLSWNDAPEWAEYLAQDANGEWFWYETQPEPSAANWIVGDCRGRYQAAKLGWRATLERRKC